MNCSHTQLLNRKVQFFLASFSQVFFSLVQSCMQASIYVSQNLLDSRTAEMQRKYQKLQNCQNSQLAACRCALPQDKLQNCFGVFSIFSVKVFLLSYQRSQKNHHKSATNGTLSGEKVINSRASVRADNSGSTLLIPQAKVK